MGPTSLPLYTISVWKRLGSADQLTAIDAGSCFTINLIAWRCRVHTAFYLALQHEVPSFSNLTNHRFTPPILISTMRLGRRCVLWECVSRTRRVHLHLRSIRSHSLGYVHVATTGRLLYHHRSAHCCLRIHKWRCTRVRSDMSRLWNPLVHIEWRHRLSVRELCMRGNRRRIRNGRMLKPRGWEQLRRRRRHLHAMIIKVRVTRAVVLLRIKVRRTVWYTQNRRNIWT